MKIEHPICTNDPVDEKENEGKNIYTLKLFSGEEIICTKVKDTDDFLIVKLISTIQRDTSVVTKINLYATPFLLTVTTEQEIAILKSSIVTIAIPNRTVIRKYIEESKNVLEKRRQLNSELDKEESKPPESKESNFLPM
jgi:hypothetical protein